jgi:hypothetical protein
MKKSAVFVLFLVILTEITVVAQTASTTNLGLPSTSFDMTGMPQWTKDLRRAEIVAFGSFPFTMFLATEIMDSFRYFNNGNNPAYAPWPFKAAGAVEMSAQEHKQVLLYAALGSVAISLADFVIVQVKRSSARKRALSLPHGTPIIIKTPLNDEPETEVPDTFEAPDDPEVPGSFEEPAG